MATLVLNSKEHTLSDQHLFFLTEYLNNFEHQGRFPISLEMIPKSDNFLAPLYAMGVIAQYSEKGLLHTRPYMIMNPLVMCAIYRDVFRFEIPNAYTATKLALPIDTKVDIIPSEFKRSPYFTSFQHTYGIDITEYLRETATLETYRPNDSINCDPERFTGIFFKSFEKSKTKIS